VVAALVVSPWGLSKHPVWTSVELYKVFCAVVAFLIWAAVGWFTLQTESAALVAGGTVSAWPGAADWFCHP
jgi:hypothetical protein